MIQLARFPDIFKTHGQCQGTVHKLLCLIPDTTEPLA